jgi:hypothetical protein
MEVRIHAMLVEESLIKAEEISAGLLCEREKE